VTGVNIEEEGEQMKNPKSIFKARKRVKGTSETEDDHQMTIKYNYNDGAITAVKYEVAFDFFLS
jgi:hypothetical protein